MVCVSEVMPCELARTYYLQGCLSASSLEICLVLVAVLPVIDLLCGRLPMGGGPLGPLFLTALFEAGTLGSAL